MNKSKAMISISAFGVTFVMIGLPIIVSAYTEFQTLPLPIIAFVLAITCGWIVLGWCFTSALAIGIRDFFRAKEHMDR